ncbi:hypothetical protein OPV22_023813 [Ensete ventricosum]|uniref:Uncharacterized protein n=1 Tax=Ensete ventricosum TaxID=4639 RepID=A0AAV8QN57_ENSVE|nr:hypothetical protein OPV22_023813 [Ensete ventricosum]
MMTTKCGIPFSFMACSIRFGQAGVDDMFYETGVGETAERTSSNTSGCLILGLWIGDEAFHVSSNCWKTLNILESNIRMPTNINLQIVVSQKVLIWGSLEDVLLDAIGLEDVKSK